MCKCVRTVLVLALGGMLWAAPARADQRQANELRERAQALKEKAQRLDEEGRHDEAQQLKRKVDEIYAKADRVAGQGPRERGFTQSLRDRLRGLYKEWIEAHIHERYDLAEDIQRKVHELTRDAGARMEELLKPQLEMMERRIDELREEGKMELADRLAGQLRQLIQAHQQGPHHSPHAEGMRPRESREHGPEGHHGPDPGPGPQDRAELERRMHHLRAAADNLHAIGMQDLAQQLCNEADSIQRALEGPPHPDDGDPHQAVESLWNEIRNLHERCNELNRRLDELSEMLRRERR